MGDGSSVLTEIQTCGFDLDLARGQIDLINVINFITVTIIDSDLKPSPQCSLSIALSHHIIS